MISFFRNRLNFIRKKSTRPITFAPIIMVIILVVFFVVLQRSKQNTIANASADVTVGQWDRFETNVTNTQTYTDPYNDVTLNVTYTKPDGTTVNFWGFYDGGTTWKIRFMPDELGSWSYVASFSDGQPGINGTFTTVPSNIPGMISADESNPLWFGFKGGNHILIRSFMVGDRFFASNWPDTSRQAFLDWAQLQGYNTLSISSHYLNRNVAGHGAGWSTPALWPLNAAEYQKMEAILNQLASRQIIVHPFGGFFGKNSNFPTNPADQTKYIKYTLARIAPYWNVMLSVAGPEPVASLYLSAAQVNQLGTQIQSMDVFHHLLSVHNGVGSDQFINSNWYNFGTIQGGHTTYLPSLSSFLLSNHSITKPLFAQEVLWPGNQYDPNYTDANIRKNAYVIMMSAAALNFADMNGDSSSGFSGSMDLTQKIQARHDDVKKVWDFFSTMPYYTMSPCQNLVSTGYCLANIGQEYLVYLDTIKSVNVNLGGKPFNYEWINAQNTADRRPGGITLTGQNMLPPAGADDWILHLTSTSIVPTPTPLPTITPLPTPVPTPTIAPTLTPTLIPSPSPIPTITPPTPTSTPVAQGFYRAINFDGPALVIDGNNWEGSTTTNYTINGWTSSHQTTTLIPATDANRATMIRNSMYYAGMSASMTGMPSGSYAIYLYVWQPTSPKTYSILINGQVVLANFNSGVAGSWSKLGPWPVTITNGGFTISSTGELANFSGIEVWKTQ